MLLSLQVSFLPTWETGGKHSKYVLFFLSSTAPHEFIILPILQTNVKGTLLASRAFIPTADPQHAALLGLTSGITPLPATYLVGVSAYVSSKLAKTKIYEYLAAENPGIFIASVHPGFVLTDIFSTNGASPNEVPMDDSMFRYETHTPFSHYDCARLAG